MLSGTEYCSTASYGEATATYGEAWHCGSAEQEARCLLPLLHAGGLTLADVLNLIRVPQEEGRLLLAFTEKYPELKWKVERSLDYRLRVEREFRRLAGDSRIDAAILTTAAQLPVLVSNQQVDHKAQP